MQQNKIEKILFTLLRMSLDGFHDNSINWSDISDEEWKECYRLAVKHGVMAVAWDGVMLLSLEEQPSRPIRLSWGVAVKSYEERYERYCKTATELSEFYEGHGITMVQLKGVGLSSYYPVPAHREGGDIDIFTYSSDIKKISNEEANEMADRLMEEQGIEVDKAHSKHSNFFYRNISIENHKVFLDIKTNVVARPMNELLLLIMRPQKTPLCNGKYAVYTPSPEFNALFLSFHAGQHYCSGFKLHHLFDWACMLKKHGLCLSPEIKDKKLLNFIYSLTEICNKFLGTTIDVPSSKSLSEEVYEQLMHPRFSGEPPKNKILVFAYKLLKLFHTHYKQSTIFRKPLIGVIWHSIVFHIKRPDTIFTVGH